jgi:hypothetical protein
LPRAAQFSRSIMDWMMKEKGQSDAKARYGIWILILIMIPLSWHMHHLYGQLHMPMDVRDSFIPHVMDVLYLYAVGFAFASIGLSIFCLIKRQYIFGIFALLVSIVALVNVGGRF